MTEGRTEERSKPRIVHIVGARPNFMKAAPVMKALARTGGTDQRLVHTGQHYDDELSAYFFEDLGLPRPDVNLGVGSGSHAVQTAEVMKRIEPVLEEVAPDWVFVVGDVNSTVAVALTAVKLGFRVAHVEAGLRSGDRTMPEEINRLLTDQISDALFTTEQSASDNLRREGVADEKIYFVGNVMIDTLDRLRARADSAAVCDRLGLREREFVLVTLHRPANVDREERFRQILRALEASAEDHGLPVVFPMHPRTEARLGAFGLEDEISRMRIIQPQRYLDFLGLMDAAGVVLTDSGGIQEETTVLGVPCLTLRPNTERPVTLTEGTNHLVQDSLDRLPQLIAERLEWERRATRPPLWDGRAAERIADITLGQLLSA